MMVWSGYKGSLRKCRAMSQGAELEQTLQMPDVLAAEAHIDERAENMGHRVVEWAQNGWDALRSRLPRLALVGTMALSGAVTSEAASAEPAGSSTAAHTACVANDPNTVSFNRAGNIAVPFAKNVISAYHHAHRSEVKRKKNQQELYGFTFRHLKEVDITAPVSGGEYDYMAQFSGKIEPQNLVAVGLYSVKYKQINGVRSRYTLYDFYLAKTRGDFEDPHQGLQWRMKHAYASGHNGDSQVISRLANGNELSGTYSMTAPNLKDGLRQAEGVLTSMVKHRSVAKQQNLNASEPPQKIC